MVDKLIARKGNRRVQVITRYNLNDFWTKASDLKALEKLVKNGVEVKGVKDLHSKVYIFGDDSVIITSANFTYGGFILNKEFGIVSNNQAIVSNSVSYFQSLWNCTDTLLSECKIDEFKKELSEISKKTIPIILKDYGESQMKGVVRNKGYFVKFYGRGHKRASPDKDVRGQINEVHCHFALTYPNNKKGYRPRQIKDGDVVFIAQMIEGGGYAIFGKAIARSHDDKRDYASQEDINQCPEKERYPVYIRVHSGEFIDTTLYECPDMKNLMQVFNAYSFRSTKDKITNISDKDINPNSILVRKAWCEKHILN